MKFDQIVEEIKKQRKYAADSLEGANPQTIRARQGRKQNAKSRLQDLFFDYRQEVRSRVLVMAIVGSHVDEFVSQADAVQGGLPSMEGTALYKKLAEKLDKRLLEKGETSNYVLETISSYLEDAAIDMGVKSYNQLVYKSKYQKRITSVEVAENFIKDVISEQIGPDMNALFVLDSASRLAFEEDFSGKVYPILVKVRDEESLKNLISGLKTYGAKAIVVSTDESSDPDVVVAEGLDEDSVIETLKKVKQKAQSR
jgi:nitrogenase subunit NifH